MGLYDYYGGKPFDIKCYDDLYISLDYIRAWAELEGKLSDYEKWLNKTESKIVKLKSNGEIDHFTGYLCKNFGIPTLVFTCIIFLSMSYFPYSIVKEKFPDSRNESENVAPNQNSNVSQGEEISENENDEQRESENDEQRESENDEQRVNEN